MLTSPRLFILSTITFLLISPHMDRSLDLILRHRNFIAKFLRENIHPIHSLTLFCQQWMERFLAHIQPQESFKVLNTTMN